MKVPLVTISPIGKRKGFTFIEVMVALVILSSGIVLVYKSLFLCVDYLRYISARIHAAHLLEERLADVRRSMALSTDGVVDVGPVTQVVDIHHKKINFVFDISLVPAGEVTGLYDLSVLVRFNDGKRRVQLVRHAYLMR